MLHIAQAVSEWVANRNKLSNTYMHMGRAQNKYLKLVSHILKMVTLLHIINDSSIENVQ